MAKRGRKPGLVKGVVESLETWVAWQYYSQELRWSIDRIAYELNVNERRFKEWVNASANTMTRLADSQPEKVKEILAKLKEKHPTSTPVEREMPAISISAVVKLYSEELTLAEIAQKLKVKHDDFIFWWNQNLKIINLELRKLRSASDVITM